MMCYGVIDPTQTIFVRGRWVKPNAAEADAYRAVVASTGHAVGTHLWRGDPGYETVRNAYDALRSVVAERLDAEEAEAANATAATAATKAARRA